MPETGEGFKPLQFIKNKFHSYQERKKAAALSKLGIEVDKEVEEARRLERDKYELGCVVRSIESAFGVKATNREWAVRTESLTQPPTKGGSIRGVTSYDDEEYLRWLSHERSPLGEEIRKHNMQKIARGYDVRKALEDQKIVLMTMFLEMPNLGRAGFHMAHVRLDQDQMIMVSDNNSVMFGFQSEGNYPSFVFTPKSSPTPKSIT